MIDPAVAIAIAGGVGTVSMAVSKLAVPAIKTVCNLLEVAVKPVAGELGQAGAELVKRHIAEKQLLVEAAHHSIVARAELSHRNLIESQQENLEKVLKQAILLLEELTEDGMPPNERWNEAFRAGAREAYDDEMQRVWANILVAEYQRPGTINRRSMIVIKSLIREDAELFHRFLGVTFGNSFILIDESPHQLQYAELTISDVTHMVSIGLVSTEQPLRMSLTKWTMLEDSLIGLKLDYHGNQFFAYVMDGGPESIRILKLTDTGVALSRVLSVPCNVDAVRSALRFLVTEGFHLRLVKSEGNGAIEVSENDMTDEQLGQMVFS